MNQDYPKKSSNKVAPKAAAMLLPFAMRTVYGFERSFRVRKAIEPKGEITNGEKVFEALNRAERILVKVELHILWQERRFTIDVNQAFVDTNQLVLFDGPNSMGNRIDNATSMAYFFKWMADITEFAARTLKGLLVEATVMPDRSLMDELSDEKDHKPFNLDEDEDIDEF